MAMIRKLNADLGTARLELLATDQPGEDGVHNYYGLNYITDAASAIRIGNLSMHRGVVQAQGYIGWTDESLIAIVIDRLGARVASRTATFGQREALKSLKAAAESLVSHEPVPEPMTPAEPAKRGPGRPPKNPTPQS